MNVEIRGDFLVFLGALMMFWVGLEQFANAFRTAVQGRWIVSIGYALCAFGSVMIGRAVWMAA